MFFCFLHRQNKEDNYRCIVKIDLEKVPKNNTFYDLADDEVWLAFIQKYPTAKYKKSFFCSFSSIRKLVTKIDSTVHILPLK